MAQFRTARLFQNGGSQAVRLPAEFRFEGDEVFISRDDATGDVTISSHEPGESWADFFAYVDSLNARDAEREEFGAIMDEIVAERAEDRDLARDSYLEHLFDDARHASEEP